MRHKAWLQLNSKFSSVVSVFLPNVDVMCCKAQLQINSKIQLCKIIIF